MRQYLKETLGIPIKESQWENISKLPLYLRNGREYMVLRINGIEVLVIHADSANFRLASHVKQIGKLQEYWNHEIVLWFDSLTGYQRKALIESNLSFVVPGSQLYLPRLGVVLQERMAMQKKSVQQFSATAQLMYIYLLKQCVEHPVKQTELIQALNINKMGCTRGVQELETTGLIRTEKVGRSNYVYMNWTGKQAYEEAKGYLINPVQKVLFVKSKPELTGLPMSGESALAECSMLNPPSILCRAIGRKAYKEQNDIEVVDPAWCCDSDYIKLEIWKYDPQVLSTNGMVDVISLVASMKDEKDDRIGMAIDEILEDYQWYPNAKWQKNS